MKFQKLTFLSFFILALATWRISSFFANEEEGPFSIFLIAREKAGKLEEKSKFWKVFGLQKGLTCEWCNSLWFSTVLVTLWQILGERFLKVILPLSISTLVIFLKEFLERKKV